MEATKRRVPTLLSSHTSHIFLGPYLQGFGARLSMALFDESSGLTKHCFVINGTSADACFVTRPDQTTAGEFKVGLGHQRYVHTILHESHTHFNDPYHLV